MSSFRLSVWFSAFAILFTPVGQVTWGQATETARPSDSGSVDLNAGDPATENSRPTDQQQAAFDQRLAEFNQVRNQLADALGDQQQVYIRFVNREDRTPAARELYFEKRQRVRVLFDKAYRSALDVTETGVLDEPLVRFIMTMIQHRVKMDRYDSDTFEGAAKMLDAGQEMQFLYAAAARSALVVGQFDAAERLFQPLLASEKLSDIDPILYSNLERYKEQWEAEQKIREQEESEDRLPRVMLKTTQGEVTLELFLDQAPTAVSNFIHLVEDRFYDGLDFYQVIDHALALTGDPSGVGSGNSGKFIKDEHQREGARKAFRGSLLMAKAPLGDTGRFIPHSASSQFAILFLPVASASDQQTVFGRVVEGMEAISRLQRVDPNKKKEKGEIVMPADSIIEATVIRRPETLPEPEYVKR